MGTKPGRIHPVGERRPPRSVVPLYGSSYTWAEMTNYETISLHVIRQWCEASGYWPGHVPGDPSRVRIGGGRFAPAERLELMDWEDWYQQFRKRRLKFVYDPTQSWFDLQSRNTRPD